MEVSAVSSCKFRHGKASMSLSKSLVTLTAELLVSRGDAWRLKVSETS